MSEEPKHPVEGGVGILLLLIVLVVSLGQCAG